MRVLVAVATRHGATREPVADGDNRDWPSIRAWGRDIGSALAQVVRSVS